MDIKENIIAIRSRNIGEADKAFDEFMAKTERCFNERSLVEPNLYKNCSPTELEKVTERLLKDVCPSTPFRPEDIKLVSGNKWVTCAKLRIKISGAGKIPTFAI